MDDLGITRCTFLGRFQIWCSHHCTILNWAGKHKTLMKPWWYEIWPPPFWMVQLAPGPTFWGVNLNTEMPILASSTCHTQNGDWGTRRGSSDLLQIGSFSFCLGPFDSPIVLLNMARSVIAVKYLEIWPTPFGMVQLASRLIFWGDSESGQGNFKFPL
jgi:hypothetical protein